ncbi:MAG: HPr family phosphocarrier protein [Lachnospiraceae bacterium]|nr:HPr family phosphocarrier protein [Lachnospiraceae bacterium]
MTTIQISIQSYKDIQDFTKIISNYTNDFDLVQGRYIVNAKSTMGILSLDISKPLFLNIRDAGSMINQILADLSPFTMNNIEE